MKTLTGKVALVTGGSRGLGAATALALAEQGANVAISYVVAKDRAAGVVRGIDALGVRGASFQADQGDPFAASAVVDRAVERFGHIDILVSNASVDAHGSVADPDRHQPTFDHFWSVALAGYMATVRAAAKLISEDGRIVMIGSNLGTRTGAPGFADLAAAKGAIDGFARGVARDLAPRRVTVNVVHSGIMDTEIHGEAGESAFKSFFSTLCFPRFARIEEVVAPILFFASPAASFITGSSIDADGGFNAESFDKEGQSIRLRLEGRIAVITGSSSGIGLATAKRFVAEGAFVFMNGRNQNTLSAAVETIGGNVRGIQGDVANLSDLDRLFEVVKSERGRIDILYANAGAGGGSPLAEVSEEHFDAIIGTNMRGTLFTVQKALPLLTNGASIILQGSIAGSRGRPGRSVYNASKAALRSFARTWAQELKGRNVRVNLLVPGPTATNALAGASPEAKAFLASQVLRGTIADPDEVASAALFLASEESSFVNATEFFVDGGAAQI